ncbi:MAG: M28 family peptidase [Mongoliibacter sp.]|uniref:M28 family peptidase n=1 Tax=Mongoliibacter sp. TaxID=2022438 RepID=UPI0012F06081|nr:M28 family peptidase [Mongoliibacter sp.]TVP44645.1 MAG: M28 family peptidase [Mongoliibacter sp.]
MKFKITLAVFALTFCAQAQDEKERIENSFDEKEAISSFRFLASDELMGRDPIRPEIDAASRYIAEQFWKYGTKELEGADGYYQKIPFRLSGPPQSGTLRLGEQTFTQGDDILVLDGEDFTGSHEIIVLGYGLENDYEGKDVKGKIVVTNIGEPGKLGPADLFSGGRKKLALAKERGALGLIEIFNVPTLPWQMATNFLNRAQLTIDTNPDEQSIPYLWLKDPKNILINAIGKGEYTNAEIKILGKVNRSIIGKNVVAFIEGTDPILKDEFVMLSAHYDHIGVGKPNAEGDSIYNGARDNAVGTVAIMKAAKYFAEHPPKRSIIFCAWTAEEKGLLGSAYFADNPLVPLNQVIYNLNIDNGGYNDTSIITVIGFGRTSVDPLIAEATEVFGLKTIADPSPEQGLYDRSDNVNFARKGIPSPTFSLGFTAFDDEITRHYHQPSDEVDNFDLEYAVKYWKSYILTAEKIANHPERPQWKEGDKYEQAAKELYSLDN